MREEPDDGRNVIITVRVDTGQVIGKPRPMTLNEMAESQARKRQPSFDFNGNAEVRDHDDHDGPDTRDTDPAPAPDDVEDRPSTARKKKKPPAREAQ